jgi:hypothetical protein
MNLLLVKVTNTGTIICKYFSHRKNAQDKKINDYRSHLGKKFDLSFLIFGDTRHTGLDFYGVHRGLEAGYIWSKLKFAQVSPVYLKVDFYKNAFYFDK